MFILLLAGCDPYHTLKLENGRKDTDLEVLYSSNYFMKRNVTVEGSESIRDVNIDTIRMMPGETMEIGAVAARYKPRVSDVHFDFLEIRYNKDTIILKGRDAIFQTIQKVESLDWRFIIK